MWGGEWITLFSSQARRVRVVVEAPAPFSFSVREAAAMSECEVVHCAGPGAGRACPVLAGAPCRAVANADVVVASLGLDRHEARGILEGLQSVHPGVPVVVLAWHTDLTRYGGLLDGVRVVTFPWTLAKLRAAIGDAVHDTAAATH